MSLLLALSELLQLNPAVLQRIEIINDNARSHEQAYSNVSRSQPQHHSTHSSHSQQRHYYTNKNSRQINNKKPNTTKDRAPVTPSRGPLSFKKTTAASQLPMHHKLTLAKPFYHGCTITDPRLSRSNANRWDPAPQLSWEAATRRSPFVPPSTVVTRRSGSTPPSFSSLTSKEKLPTSSRHERDDVTITTSSSSSSSSSLWSSHHSASSKLAHTVATTFPLPLRMPRRQTSFELNLNDSNHSQDSNSSSGTFAQASSSSHSLSSHTSSCSIKAANTADLIQQALLNLDMNDNDDSDSEFADDYHASHDVLDLLTAHDNHEDDELLDESDTIADSHQSLSLALPVRA